MNIKQKLTYSYCFILGLFGFSILGQYLLIDILNMPFYLIEIFFLPVILLNLSRIIYLFRSARILTILLVLLVLTSMLSNILSSGQLFSSIIAYRSILYLLLCYCFFRNNQYNLQIKVIYTIALGAVIGELIYVLKFSTSVVTSSTNMLAIAIVILVPFMQKKYIITAISILFSLFLSINTGFRIGILSVIFTILIMFIYILINSNQYRNISQKSKYIIFFGFGFLGVIYFVSNLYAIVGKIAQLTGMDSFAVFRVTTRLESLLSFDFSTSQDTGRIEMFNILSERVWNLIPRGLLGFNKGGLEYSYYIDVPLSYLIDIFGSIVTFIIIIFFLFQFILKAKIKDVNSQVKVLSIWLLPLLGFLILTNGTFMVNTAQAIMTGTILGYVVKKETSLNNKRK